VPFIDTWLECSLMCLKYVHSDHILGTCLFSSKVGSVSVGSLQ